MTDPPSATPPDALTDWLASRRQWFRLVAVPNRTGRWTVALRVDEDYPQRDDALAAASGYAARLGLETGFEREGG